MDGKVKNTTSDDVRDSVSSIYSELLAKRRKEREEKEEQKRLEKEAKEQEKLNNKDDKDATKMTKKEREEAAYDKWKEVFVNLTGDDIEYTKDKKKKKKYRKWIDDDTNTIMDAKPKKVKKKNYNKEFAPELNMLRNLVADQNRFTADLQKRYNISVGPNNKDAMPLNKTQVELASVINNSRSNALGVLNAISGIKKSIAELYFKQVKADAESGGSTNIDSTDLGLMGSSIASGIIASNQANRQQSLPNTPDSQVSQSFNEIPETLHQQIQPQIQQQAFSSFDPSTWEGPSVDPTDSVNFENVPHSIVVEWNKDQNLARFKAIKDEDGSELKDCPVPTVDPMRLKFNEKDRFVRGEFDETYKLEII